MFFVRGGVSTLKTRYSFGNVYGLVSATLGDLTDFFTMGCVFYRGRSFLSYFGGSIGGHGGIFGKDSDMFFAICLGVDTTMFYSSGLVTCLGNRKVFFHTETSDKGNRGFKLFLDEYYGGRT